jgi:DNA polymerase IV
MAWFIYVKMELCFLNTINAIVRTKIISIFVFMVEKRYISHFDLDAFFVSVECLKNSAFKGKPLLVGGNSDRAVVAAASYEARKFGVHSAMPMKMAKKLCPHAIIIGGDMESYSKYSRMVTQIISEHVPVYEKASIDEFYADLTGMDKFFGCEKFTTELRMRIIKETGLPISYGLSASKFISKVATDAAKPNGQLYVPHGTEKSFLAPMHINKIPGVGEKTGDLLQRMGIHTIQTLSEMPIEYLETLLGKYGHELWRKAQGIDNTPVQPYQEQKSISTESTFETDTTDMHFLHKELVRMVEKIGFELRDQEKLTACIAIKIRYSNFDTVTKQVTIPYTCADGALLKHAHELFIKLFDKRLLIRLLGVRVSHLVHGNYQISLFDNTEEEIKLYQSIDAIKRRFGYDMLMRGAAPQRTDKQREALWISKKKPKT